MREIKFRAWDAKLKKMLPVCVADFENGEYQAKYTTSYGTSFNGTYAISRGAVADLMQFTGLKDKNGKEIYEGDLYRYGIRISEVVWDFTGWKLKPKMQDGIPWEYDTIDPFFEFGEVIGNIYENKDLLI